MERANILVVDDELGPREALRMILKDDYRIFFATNGLEAVEHTKNQPPDLVIMDMKMPVMDGLQALKRIKEINPYISVLMVTGYGTIDTAVEAMKIGAIDYITKPFDSFSILQKVKGALEENKKKIEAQQMLLQIQDASDKLTQQQEDLQKQVIQLSKLSSIGMLAQGIAHNLSSPLLIILGRAELMKEKLVQFRMKLESLSKDSAVIDPNEASLLFREYDQNVKDTEIIIENVVKLTEIIKNMMQKSRQDQAQDPQLLNLSDILRQELKFLEADLFFKHNVEKQYSLAPDLPLIRGVYSDFSQAFLNIIRNSLDAMFEADPRKLTVATYHDERFVYVSFNDTGCGIPEEHLEKIFEPYFTTKKGMEGGNRPVGTGLGLHMVKILMEPYKATIDVRSKPGNTTFVFKIPYGL